MDNIINNGNTNNSNGNTNNGSGLAYNSLPDAGNNNGNNNIQHLRDVCNILSTVPVMPTGDRAYEHIIEMMRGISLHDDGILLNHKIKSIESDFCNIVHDESMLCESMNYINNKALENGDTAQKFAILFSSRNFDALAMKETKVRSAMLKILETNFLNADAYRAHDKNRLYNSITLLGEYYHRVRLADNSPIMILGESLLNLLIRELSDTRITDIDARLARLVLSQITLNGDIMRARHKAEVTQLLFHIRRNLIDQPSLNSAVKALLLMTLDVYYSNFTNIGKPLEELYTKYLIEQSEENEDNNNCQNQMPPQAVQAQQHQHYHQSVNYSCPAHNPTSQLVEAQLSNFEKSINLNSSGSTENANDSFEVKPPTKKWSEQVCEDSVCEIEFTDAYNSHYEEDSHKIGVSDHCISNEIRSSSRNNRRAFQPRSSPRPLKQNYNDNEDYQNSQQHPQQRQPKQSTQHQQQQQNQSPQQQTTQSDGVGEDRDQSKPLPRWRAPRFNRRADSGEGDQYNNRGYEQRRHSISVDDDIDQHSVRSEDGSLRLYSINDRMKHSHERFERSTGAANNYSNIANSNWDRQSQRDDRSERSYISNYERGNYKRGGRYNNHNRVNYDKPPRFQKHQQQLHQNKDDLKIHSESWRRSISNVSNAQQDENCSYNSNGADSQSRSSSRARTLPRPPKSHMEGNTSGRHGNYHHNQRQSQSPSGQYQQQRNTRNYNARYSSQSSLASDASNTMDRLHQHQRQRNFSRRNQRQDGQSRNNEQHHAESQRQNWHNKSKDDNESELVNQAQKTTKLMDFLSSQK